MLLETLETPRLHLRLLTPADREPLMEFFSNPIATEFQFVGDDIEAYVDTWFQRTQWRYETHGHGTCAVELKATGELIGQAGLFIQELDNEPFMEIGYHFIRRFWGNGYASEAAIALKNHAFETGMAEEVYSFIHPQNFRSQAVARRNGMTPWREAIWREHPILVFGIKRETFIQSF